MAYSTAWRSAFCGLLLAFSPVVFAAEGAGQPAQPAPSAQPQEKPLDKVQFRESWLPGERFAPMVIGQELGFFKAEGLEVELIPGKGSTIVTKLVANKENEFGFASGYTALAARTKGLPLMALAVFFQKSPIGVISPQEKGIVKPKDLLGKKIATDIQSTKHEQFTAFLKKNRVDKSRLTFIPVTGEGMGPVLAGRADAWLHFSNQDGVAMRQKGVPYNEMIFADYGVRAYDQSLIAHEDTVKTNAGLCRRFVRAWKKSWEYGLAHPEEAIDALVKRYPELAPEKELYLLRFKAQEPFIMAGAARKKGFGFQTKQGWQDTQDVLLEAGIIDHKIRLEDFFTTEFLKY